MKILITGKNGQLGWELCRAFAQLGELTALDHKTMDLTNPDSITRGIRKIKPEIIINAAAYTAVDMAESEPDIAMAVNGTACEIIANEAKKLGAFVIHYSTDYVFDGKKKNPYTEDDKPTPLNVYGKSKLAGEKAIQAADVPHLIFRTSWLYEVRGRNFFLTILRLAREKKETKVVDDQIGAPTWSRVVAEATAKVFGMIFNLKKGGKPTLNDKYCGIYHLSAGGETSWYGFAKAIFNNVGQLLNRPLPKLTPIPTSDYPTPAERPLYSVLDNTKLKTDFGLIQVSWQNTLSLFMSNREGIKIIEAFFKN